MSSRLGSNSRAPETEKVKDVNETIQKTGRRMEDAKVIPRDRFLGLTICLHPDYRRVGEVALLFDFDKSGGAEISRKQPLFRKPGPTAPLPAPVGSRYVSAGVLIEVSKTKNRSVEIACLSPSKLKVKVNGNPLAERTELDDEAVTRGVVLSFSEGVVLLLHIIENTDELTSVSESELGIYGWSNAVRKLRADIKRKAATDNTVLILGETGAGKERAAQALRDNSARVGRCPYLAHNLNNVDKDKLETLLFGFVGGIFANAPKDRSGLFQAANKGTLFLDEVGDVSIDIQNKLLRAVQTKTILPLGALTPITVDVRLLFATDKNLEEKMEAGTVTKAFYSRLQRCVVTVPPLRERRDDICRLFFYFLEIEAAKQGQMSRLTGSLDGSAPWCFPDLIQTLLDYDWPFNVRDLENAVSQIVADNLDQDADAKMIINDTLLDNLCNPNRRGTKIAPGVSVMTAKKRTNLSKIPREVFEKLYNAHQTQGPDGKRRGNRRAIARELKISQNSVDKLICETFKLEEK